MDVVQLRPRLWRWALPHPDGEPADAEGGALLLTHGDPILDDAKETLERALQAV